MFNGIIKFIRCNFCKKSIKNKLTEASKISESRIAADLTDYIVLYLEAGAHVEHAFFESSKHLKWRSQQEIINKIFSSCKLGFSFRESLEIELKRQNENSFLREIIETINLSLKMGTPLVKTLSHLSFYFRMTAITRLEELAGEAPIKMILPLVLFIFPVIFILLGAGAVENLIKSISP